MWQTIASHLIWFYILLDYFLIYLFIFGTGETN